MFTNTKFRQTLTNSGMIFILALLFLIIGQANLAQSQEKRKNLNNQMPSHLPIETEVKNLDKEDWLKDLEIKVTNTEKKPIYYIKISIEFPDVIWPDGNKGYGFPLYYGRNELLDVDNLATPDDVPIKAGDSYVFKIPESFVEGWKSSKRTNNFLEPKTVKIHFHFLNFGDGTGLATDKGIPVSKPQPQKSLGKLIQ